MLADLGALLTALAAVGGMVWQGARTRADIRQMRQATRVQVNQVADQLQPNHGGSLADAIRRTEALASTAVDLSREVKEDQNQLRGDINGLRVEVRSDREAARGSQLQLTAATNELGALRLAFAKHLGRKE